MGQANADDLHDLLKEYNITGEVQKLTEKFDVTKRIQDETIESLKKQVEELQENNKAEIDSIKVDTTNLNTIQLEMDTRITENMADISENIDNIALLKIK